MIANLQPAYRVFLSLNGRRRNPVRHIGQAQMGLRGMETKSGTGQCGVHVNWYPESGEQGKVENATCPGCRRKHGLPPLPRSS
jgi:hypothetical protein